MAHRHETALITGASAGIGAELADQFAHGGHDVVLVARREEKLRTLAASLEDRYGVTASVIVQDLAETDGAEQLYATVRERDHEIGVLVNNVGIGTHGLITDIDINRERDQLQLNMVTPTILTKLFGRAMVERGHGKVLNVASSAGFQPGPFMAVYYASKSYMLSFSEAIAEELRAEGITVSVLCPGPVETDFLESSGMADTAVGNAPTQDARTVAEVGYRGLMNGKTVIVPGLEYKLLERAVGVTPRSLVRKLSRHLNESRSRTRRNPSSRRR